MSTKQDCQHLHFELRPQIRAWGKGVPLDLRSKRGGTAICLNCGAERSFELDSANTSYGPWVVRSES